VSTNGLSTLIGSQTHVSQPVVRLQPSCQPPPGLTRQRPNLGRLAKKRVSRGASGPLSVELSTRPSDLGFQALNPFLEIRSGEQLQIFADQLGQGPTSGASDGLGFVDHRSDLPCPPRSERYQTPSELALQD
jgi:hypothetical protein